MPKKIITKKFTIISMVIALTIFSLTYMVMAAGSEPGSQEDPIVTQSYVELRNQQLKFYIDESIKKIQGSGNQSGGSSSGQAGLVFEVVNVPAGKKLIAGGGTELILRSGEASAIGNTAGDGISNVTIGQDLRNGTVIQRNHLIIVPRSDGRGANSKTNTIFMVKGSYSIE